MIIIDELKEGFNMMLHPDSATQKERKIGGALAFYYKISIIPLILYIIFALVMPKAPTTLGVFSGLISGVGIISGIIDILIFIPIAFFISALIIHIFGKLFRVFSNPYSNTFTANVYGEVPAILFYWLLPIMSLLLVIFAIWSFIVLIIAVANQQKTSKLKAFGVIFAPAIIALAIALLFFAGIFAVGTHVSPTAFSATCIPNPGFYCSNPAMHSGVLMMTLGQATGATISNITFCFVPQGNSTISSCNGYPSYYVSKLSSGGTANVSFSGAPIFKSSTVAGEIWMSYYNSSGAGPFITNVASVMVQAK